MAGDLLAERTGATLAVGDYLFVPSAERSFQVESITDAPWPGTRLVTLATGSSHWTMPVDHDETCAIEVLS